MSNVSTEDEDEDEEGEQLSEEEQPSCECQECETADPAAAPRNDAATLPQTPALCMF